MPLEPCFAMTWGSTIDFLVTVVDDPTPDPSGTPFCHISIRFSLLVSPIVDSFFSCRFRRLSCRASVLNGWGHRKNHRCRWCWSNLFLLPSMSWYVSLKLFAIFASLRPVLSVFFHVFVSLRVSSLSLFSRSHWCGRPERYASCEAPQ